MLEVPIDKILSITDARNSFNKIVEDVENDSDGIYILTKGGSPVVALINIMYLENLSGDKVSTKEVKPMQTEGQPQPENPPVPSSQPPTSPLPGGGSMPTPGESGSTPPSPTPLPNEPSLPSTGEGELPTPAEGPSPTPSGGTPSPAGEQPWNR